MLMKLGAGCPAEIVFYIHGFNKNPIDAKEEFNRIQSSLNDNKYRIPLLGWSWNSNTDYFSAQKNAKVNGPILAEFITELKSENNCPNTDIHLIAHSLGAAIVTSTLNSLNNTQYLISDNNDHPKLIKSTTLLGAAISNKLIADQHFGNVIYKFVDNFYNLYDPEDDGLKYNKDFEKHNPLGLIGAINLTTPSNYIDINVAYEIPPFSDADGDGNVEECFEETKPVQWWGDNHCGYIGFRNSTTGLLLDDGAINVVLENWRNMNN
jgi:esterase/lipase superfamily enzyme